MGLFNPDRNLEFDIMFGPVGHGLMCRVRNNVLDRLVDILQRGLDQNILREDRMRTVTQSFLDTIKNTNKCAQQETFKIHEGPQGSDVITVHVSETDLFTLAESVAVAVPEGCTCDAMDVKAEKHLLETMYDMKNYDGGTPYYFMRYSQSRNVMQLALATLDILEKVGHD